MSRFLAVSSLCGGVILILRDVYKGARDVSSKPFVPTSLAWGLITTRSDGSRARAHGRVHDPGRYARRADLHSDVIGPGSAAAQNPHLPEKQDLLARKVELERKIRVFAKSA